MIALGWAPRGTAAPPPFAAVDLPHCAVIAAAPEAAATPRDRLALQVACARAFPAFLPLRPSDPVTLDAAVARAHAEGAALGARLSGVAGHVQVTLCAAWTQAAPPDASATGGGRGWLATRAATRAAFATRQAEIAVALRAVLRARMAGPVQERPRPWGLQLDGLVKAKGVEAALVDVAADLGGLRLGHPVQLTVTGPWPVLSFADAAECAA